MTYFCRLQFSITIAKCITVLLTLMFSFLCDRIGLFNWLRYRPKEEENVLKNGYFLLYLMIYDFHSLDA